MSPYRTPDYTQLLAALTQAARDMADAQAVAERARTAAIEANRREGETKDAFEKAMEAYKEARWP